MKRPLILTGALVALALALALGLWLKPSRRASNGKRAVTTALASSQANENRSAPPGQLPNANGRQAGPKPGRQSQVGLRPNLPPNLRTAIGKGPQRDFRTRLQAIAELGRNLSDAERQALYGYLRSTTAEKALRPGQAYALKNEILNTLRDQESPPPELTDVLAGLWRDPAQPLVMRDYALQHLAPWFAKAPIEQREEIVKTLQNAASHDSESWAGTALLGLRRIQQENPAAPMPSIDRDVARLVQDASANPLARITAVQLAGQMRLKQAELPVTDIARDATQPATLRIAAISALGRLGDPSGAPFLAQEASGKDSRLALAARSALALLHNSEPAKSITHGIQ